MTWLLIKDLGTREYGTQHRKVRYGLYECPICKKHFEVNSNHVNNGSSTKCKSCSVRKVQTKHGLTKTKIYRTLQAMLQRTENKSSKAFKFYGGRGISVCDEWKNSFENFYNWSMSNGYEKGLSIDRIDVDGNYEPSNCRWTTMIVQKQNTRLINSKNTSGYRGVNFFKKQNRWRAEIGVNGTHKHLGYFDTPEECAYAYDKYVIENNLAHTTNGLYKGDTA